ncbi:ABC transporter permease [Deinococcus pimensis]|uniref:ABC transporter permease n=1 Tax=Deinococcus pimensis TaxID=309888 RepID=UPI000482265F|nr:ABC transporter permease [Deinococcus pimensis]
MLNLLLLEYRKMIGFRSVRLALVVCLVLPWIWSFSPRLQQLYGLVLVSGWQVPALALAPAVDVLLPILIAVTCAELIGSEVAQGTLAPLLLRPLSRARLVGVKLVAALSYPVVLLAVLFVGSLVAGARLGLGEFAGGTGLGPGSWVGVGLLTPGDALGEITRAYVLAAFALMSVATLALLLGVALLNTAAAALATLATLLMLRQLVVFPEKLQQLLLTTHLGLYTVQDPVQLRNSLIYLLIYTVGFSLLALFTFERRDV